MVVASGFIHFGVITNKAARLICIRDTEYDRACHLHLYFVHSEKFFGALHAIIEQKQSKEELQNNQTSGT